MKCPCCSGFNYINCCQPYHTNFSNPTCVESLMRSRYSAYALPNGKYLIDTTYPSKRFQHDAQDMQDWGEQNNWYKLEIVAKPEKNKVEFKAFYMNKDGQSKLHHEISTFKKLDGKWYYFSSKFIHI